MDPRHLLADELEYEFALRQIESGDLSTLIQSLEAEATGEREQPMDRQRFTRLTVSEEIRECEAKLKEITEAIRATSEVEDDNMVIVNRSRLMHLAGRFGRLKSFAPTHTQVKKLAEKLIELGWERDATKDAFDLGAQAVMSSNEDLVLVNTDLIPGQSTTGTIPKIIRNRQRHDISPISKPALAQNPKPTLKSVFGSIADLISGINIDQEHQLNTEPKDTTSSRFSINKLKSALNPPRKVSEVQHVAETYHPPPNYHSQPNRRAQQPTQFGSGQQQYHNNSHNESYEPENHRNAANYSETQRNRNREDARQFIDTRASFARQDEADFAGGHRIRQWALRFSGAPGGIEIRNFIFRLERQATLNGVSHAALAIGIGDLLTDRAADWYWTYQQKTECNDWTQVKSALIRRYAPRRETDYEIRSRIEKRKQRPDEKFVDFCQDVEGLAVRLTRRMSDGELMDVLRQNMNSKLRVALCYQRTISIDDLIQHCDQLEEIYEDEERQQRLLLRRPARVAAVDHTGYYDSHYNTDGEFEERNQFQNSDQAIEEVNRSRNELMVCWNCKELGHVFTQCESQQLSVFCFSCGMSGVMRPQCPKCTGNGRKDARTAGVARPNFQIPPPVIIKRNSNGQTPQNPFNNSKFQPN